MEDSISESSKWPSLINRLHNDKEVILPLNTIVEAPSGKQRASIIGWTLVLGM